MEICLECSLEPQLCWSKGSRIGWREKLCPAVSHSQDLSPPHGDLWSWGSPSGLCRIEAQEPLYDWVWAGCTRGGHKHGQGSSLYPEKRVSCEPPAGNSAAFRRVNVSVSVLSLVAGLMAQHSNHYSEAEDMATQWP